MILNYSVYHGSPLIGSHPFSLLSVDLPPRAFLLLVCHFSILLQYISPRSKLMHFSTGPLTQHSQTCSVHDSNTLGTLLLLLTISRRSDGDSGQIFLFVGEFRMCCVISKHTYFFFKGKRFYFIFFKKKRHLF